MDLLGRNYGLAGQAELNAYADKTQALDNLSNNIVLQLKKRREDHLLQADKLGKLLSLLESNPSFVEMINLSKEIY